MRSKKISLGFRVINTRTGELLSEIFSRRNPAREIAAALYREQGIPTGVEQVTDYVDAEAYAAAQKAKKNPGASRDAFDRPSAERAALVKAVGLGPERLVHYQISTKELRRMAKMGERIRVGRDPQRIQKSPRDLTAREINRALDQIDAKRSKLTDRFIAQGRGSETADETWKKSDPLAREWQALGNRYGDLRNEIELRYGPRAPSRLPSGRGFGPRTR
jgi:hypothetical protein